MDELNRQNDTSAAKTEIGFDYQFYYFFYLILDLRHGEKIGIEVKDDIHVDCADGSTVLIQTKHTLQTLKSGEPANLTERDKDLWKTLSNWGKIIMEQENPIDFIYRTTFQTLFDFLIIAFSIFMVVKLINKAQEKVIKKQKAEEK